MQTPKRINLVLPKLFYPELSYKLVGVCFDVHNEIGRFAREKQYADALEQRLKRSELSYERERPIADSGNKVDFLVEDKIILELKACRRLTREHFRQTQNYLQASQFKLALLVNFAEFDLRPRRVVLIEARN